MFKNLTIFLLLRFLFVCLVDLAPLFGAKYGLEFPCLQGFVMATCDFTHNYWFVKVMSVLLMLAVESNMGIKGGMRIFVLGTSLSFCRVFLDLWVSLCKRWLLGLGRLLRLLGLRWR